MATSTVRTNEQKTSVTPLALIIAVIIAGILIGLAVPRLRAVSEEQSRPEGVPILSAYPSAAGCLSDSGVAEVSRMAAGR